MVLSSLATSTEDLITTEDHNLL